MAFNMKALTRTTESWHPCPPAYAHMYIITYICSYREMFRSTLLKYIFRFWRIDLIQSDGIEPREWFILLGNQLWTSFASTTPSNFRVVIYLIVSFKVTGHLHHLTKVGIFEVFKIFLLKCSTFILSLPSFIFPVFPSFSPFSLLYLSPSSPHFAIIFPSPPLLSLSHPTQFFNTAAFHCLSVKRLVGRYTLCCCCCCCFLPRATPAGMPRLHLQACCLPGRQTPIQIRAECNRLRCNSMWVLSGRTSAAPPLVH